MCERVVTGVTSFLTRVRTSLYSALGIRSSSKLFKAPFLSKTKNFEAYQNCYVKTICRNISMKLMSLRDREETSVSSRTIATGANRLITSGERGIKEPLALRK